VATVGCAGAVVCSGWWCVGWAPPPCSGCGFALSLAAADIDGDGNEDVIAGAGSTGLVNILFGDGAGGIARELRLQDGVGPRVDFLRIGHVDDDPYLDVVLIDAERGQLRVLRGDGTGNFGVAGDPVALGTLGVVRTAALARVDADPNMDVVVLDSTGSVHVLRPDGNGRFSTKALVVPLDFGAGVRDIAVAHVDTDEHVDLVVLDGGSASVVVLRGDGLGGFQVAGAPVAAGPSPVALTAGELDGAPGADVAVVDGRDGLVRVFFSTGDGDLLPSSQGALPLPGARGLGIRTLPRPSAPGAPADLVVAYTNVPGPSFVVGFENDGRGTFVGPGLSVPVGTLGGWGVTNLNHDDRMDLVVGNQEDGSIGFALGGERNQ
jgi:hypothetical protein